MKKLSVSINFDPTKSNQTLQRIFRDSACRTLWLLWKRRHTVSQWFNEDVLRIGIKISNLETPIATTGKIRACFSPNQGDFTYPDIANFVIENIKHFDDSRSDFVMVVYKVTI